MNNIVIDTNVLLSALRSQYGASFKLITLIGESQKFKTHISTPLVAEYEDVLNRSQSNLNEDLVADVIDYICKESHHHKIFYLWRPVLKDPDDDFVLELAVKANAKIITYNKKDFKKVDSFGIEVLTPKEFLENIGELK